MDWWVHLATSPAKQWELIDYAAELSMRTLDVDGTAPANHGDVEPMPQDKRFATRCGAAAVCLARARVPAAPAVVAARNDRRARRHTAP